MNLESKSAYINKLASRRVWESNKFMAMSKDLGIDGRKVKCMLKTEDNKGTDQKRFVSCYGQVFQISSTSNP